MKPVVTAVWLSCLVIMGTFLHAADESTEALSVGDLGTRAATMTPADTGFDNDVRAICNYNGDLIVGGYFTTADGFSSIKVAGWNGTDWYSMSGFPLGNPIYWLHEHDGLLYAGQALTQLNSWDGSSWTAHEPWLGNTFGNIWALETYNNELFVGGGFNGNPDQPSYIAQWTGSGWDTVGTGINGIVLVLDTFAGDLIAGGYFSTSAGSVGDYIAKWDGASWSPVGAGTDGGVRALTTYNSELIAAGGFTTAGAASVNNIARWNGSNWQALGGGLDGTVEALTVHDNKLIAGGYFLNAGGASAARIASWDGSSWSSIGPGFDDDVYALGEYNGYLIAGGAFSEAGGYVALWDGSVWRPVSDLVTDVEDEMSAGLPSGYSLAQNYPNPFNPTTTIEFEIPRAGYVEIDVYNLLGKQLRTLVSERLSAGRKSVIWDGTDDQGDPVSSGVYFYRITTNDHSEARKMLLLK